MDHRIFNDTVSNAALFIVELQEWVFVIGELERPEQNGLV